MIETQITRLYYKDKEIILLPTAHVSKQSVLDVKELIENERPNSVCIELDKQRFDSLNKDRKSVV